MEKPLCETMMLFQVTFLYNLTDGACPKSYGLNVARLAGLPDGVVNRAASFAKQLEDQHQSQPESKSLAPSELHMLQSICSSIKENRLSSDL